MAIKKPAGIVTPKFMELKNGIVTPQANIQLKEQNVNAQNNSGENTKGIVSPPITIKPIPRPPTKPSDKKS